MLLMIIWKKSLSLPCHQPPLPWSWVSVCLRRKWKGINCYDGLLACQDTHWEKNNLCGKHFYLLNLKSTLETLGVFMSDCFLHIGTSVNVWTLYNVSGLCDTEGYCLMYQSREELWNLYSVRYSLGFNYNRLAIEAWSLGNCYKLKIA